MNIISIWRLLPASIRFLLVTQMLFNVGFYLVVPFLAYHMVESFAVGMALVGLVLGLRTLSQQGLFFVGGALTDRWGVRTVLLTGIAIRIIGFALAAWATTFALFVAAVALIGIGAALFSPAVDAALAVLGNTVAGVSRQQIFALDAVFSRAGELAGPVIGALLIPLGFRTVATMGAVMFAIIFLIHALAMPPLNVPTTANATDGIRRALSNRLFLAFACVYAAYLVGYNQLYQGLPLELERIDAPPSLLGWMFTIAAVLSVVAQLPITSVVQQWGTARSIALGFTLQAVAFVWMAVAQNVTAIWPAVVFVVTLTAGHLVAVPAARDVVGTLAGGGPAGAYFGLVNTAGGIAVFVAATALGPLFGPAASPAPWLIVGAGLVVAAVAGARISARVVAH